jgi:hypothetical protein
VGFDLREVALLCLDPVKLIPDAQLVVQLVQLLASDPPFATRGRIFALDLRDPAGNVLRTRCEERSISAAC